MSRSNCCFLTCIQISQEAGQVVWCSCLLKNFPRFVVIHTVKGFGLVNKAEIDVYLELFCFLDDPTDAGNLISGSSAFSKTSLNIRKFTVHRSVHTHAKACAFQTLVCHRAAPAVCPGEHLQHTDEWGLCGGSGSCIAVSHAHVFTPVFSMC